MPETSSLQELLDELIRLTALQIKLGIGNQTQAILELQRIGLSTTRISQLLGTTANTVNVTIQKNKKRQVSGRGRVEQEGQPDGR